MNIRKYYQSLGHAERKAYAKRAGLSTSYIESHLIQRIPRRIPPLARMQKLSDASEGVVSLTDVIEHFLPKRPTIPAIGVKPYNPQ